MTDRDIVELIQRLFEPTVSPGQAFDALFKMRQEHVMWADVYKAVSTQGKALKTLRRLDESDEAPSLAFQCPGCGIGRTNEDYCINPACPEHKPNPETEHVRRTANPKFKNPKLSFGKYNGKTLVEVASINPGYLAWLAKDNESEFWREQAKLAQIAVEAKAPANRDTSDTGFFS